MSTQNKQIKKCLILILEVGTSRTVKEKFLKIIINHNVESKINSG